jgi:hypothetical protein
MPHGVAGLGFYMFAMRIARFRCLSAASTNSHFFILTIGNAAVADFGFFALSLQCSNADGICP